MNGPPPTARDELDRSDRLRALALDGMLSRLRVPLEGRSVLLVSDRPDACEERLRARGASVVRQPGSALASGPPPGLAGEGGPFGLVLWLDGGPDSPSSTEFEAALVALARLVAPGGWLGLGLAAPPSAAAVAGEPDGWGQWATTLWSCGLTVHDVRVTQRFGGPGPRARGWARRLPGLAYRIDRGLVMSGLRLGGNGPRLVMARGPA